MLAWRLESAATVLRQRQVVMEKGFETPFIASIAQLSSLKLSAREKKKGLQTPSPYWGMALGKCRHVISRRWTWAWFL
jgi:hypothetical protein